MKRMIFGVAMILGGSVGLAAVTISGVMLLMDAGIINGRRDFFHHISHFGISPIFGGFLLMILLGVILCSIECITKNG